MTQFLLALAAATNITVIPGMLNFGTVPVGSWINRSVTVINNENQAIDGIRVNISGPFTFQANNGCFSRLEPGGMCIIDVMFRPMSQGYDSAWLNIDLPDGTMRTVTLSGMAR